MIDQKPKVEAADEQSTNALTERLREFVRRQLRDGAEPPHLSFVLAFVATELGLAIAPDPFRVFPVVMEGITKAAANRSEAATRDGEECDAEFPSDPDRRTLH